jgi:hypothetical protein
MTTTASSLPNDTKAAETLDKVNATINSMNASSKDLTLTDLGELCKIYKSVKPLIAGIPVYGVKVVGVITFLLKVADLACP